MPVTDELVETDAPTPPATTHLHSSAHVRVELPAEGRNGVALVTIVRPEVLNALSFEVVGEISDAFEALDGHPDCRAIVLTGDGERAFAAGADIKELAVQNPTDLAREDPFTHWDRIRRIRRPIIAAVRGFALGGGCELAMACDIIVAGDDAKFGQPEIKLGVLPGMGGSQRLTRAIGKAKAMDLILTGRTIDAAEADRSGLVSRVVPADTLLEEANATAAIIAGMSLSASRMAKEAVNRAFESSLTEGLLYERRLFHSAFATADQTEAMNAFSEKRPPNFTHS
jgi:enoyl-CoA hydratase